MHGQFTLHRAPLACFLPAPLPALGAQTHGIRPLSGTDVNGDTIGVWSAAGSYPRFLPSSTGARKTGQPADA
ncbi:MAG: hypothetical protein WA952_09080 [Lewinella sp.]